MLLTFPQNLWTRNSVKSALIRMTAWRAAAGKTEVSDLVNLYWIGKYGNRISHGRVLIWSVRVYSTWLLLCQMKYTILLLLFFFILNLRWTIEKHSRILIMSYVYSTWVFWCQVDYTISFFHTKPRTLGKRIRIFIMSYARSTWLSRDVRWNMRCYSSTQNRGHWKTHSNLLLPGAKIKGTSILCRVATDPILMVFGHPELDANVMSYFLSTNLKRLHKDK